MQKQSQYLLGFVLAGLVVAFASGCATQYDKLLKSTDYELKYQKAGEYYDAGKYTRAATLYEQAAMFYRGTKQDDSLNFFLAKSHFKSGDVYTAEYYFEQFRNTFPRSVFVEEATMLRIASLYDQTFRYELDQSPSHKTLAAIDEFKYLFPHSEFMADCNKIKDDLVARLDEKQFEAAKLYYIMGDYKAATAAFRTSLRDYPDSRYREDILYLLVSSAYKYADNSYQHLQKDRFQAVIDEYYNFISEFPESKYRVEVEKMHTTANTMLNSDRNKNESKEILKNQ